MAARGAQSVRGRGSRLEAGWRRAFAEQIIAADLSALRIDAVSGGPEDFLGLCRVSESGCPSSQAVAFFNRRTAPPPFIQHCPSALAFAIRASTAPTARQ